MFSDVIPLMEKMTYKREAVNLSDIQPVVDLVDSTKAVYSAFSQHPGHNEQEF